MNPQERAGAELIEALKNWNAQILRAMENELLFLESLKAKVGEIERTLKEIKKSE